MKTEKFKFKKIVSEEKTNRVSSYEVFHEGKSIGFVWSVKGFSYRGRDGWNSGIRVQDFNPTEWRYGIQLGQQHSICSYDTRQRAADELYELQKSK